MVYLDIGRLDGNDCRTPRLLNDSKKDLPQCEIQEEEAQRHD
jgi:hypothetical protein